MHQKLVTTYIIYIALSAVSCTKGFLDPKPDSNILVPETLNDYQKLIDNSAVMLENAPGLGLLASDEFYFKQSTWEAITGATEKNAIIFSPDPYGAENQIADWNAPYSAIYYTNVVIAGLEKMDKVSKGSEAWRQIKGQALFLRALNFYRLAQIYCMPYDPASSGTTLGLPLKLNPNVDEIVQRSSLHHTYKQILADLNTAVNILPEAVDGNLRQRPSRPAAYALLARTCLTMHNYTDAAEYADSCLRLYDKVIDYNTIDTNAINPLPHNNDETILQGLLINSYLSYYNTLVRPGTIIDSVLYALYDKNDLRKRVFFKMNDNGQINIKSFYQGVYRQPFGGIATDEIYLIRSESLIRTGNIQQGISVLNTLLRYRYKKGEFIPLATESYTNALAIVLIERRKELVFRSFRWEDVRRLNTEGFNITMTRAMNNTLYALPPNDLRYAFPIPNSELSLSGIQQNPR
jgi:starch-binding outer membrane protein, SusD/RagB family